MGAGARDLGVVGLDGAREDDDVRPFDVLGPVSLVDDHAQALETARDVVAAKVGAGDVELERAQDLGEPAHPDPPDPDEMHPADAPTEHQRTSMSLRRSSAIVRAASGRPRSSARAARRLRSTSSARILLTSIAMRVASAASCRTQTAAPWSA